MGKQVDKQEKLVSLLGEFKNAMLVTRASDGALDARPMAIAEVEDDGVLWFVTDRHSGKMAELMLDDEVAVTMQSFNQFAAISGTAHAIDDHAKVEQLWQETWKVLFPKGKTDPSMILLKIEPSRGEYWDNSGAIGLKYLFKAGKAYLQGERPESDDSINASVNASVTL